ncbi:MAG: MiaB/RimO family radical SAM methylthiotransferase [Patescibacteria group bacterium]
MSNVKKYHMITYGCQANVADSERIASQLETMRYKKAKKADGADLIVLNACSVRQSAIDRLYAKVNQFKNKKIILTGCILPTDRKKLKNQAAAIWHPDEYFDLIPNYSHFPIAYIPIMTGCNNFCTFCAVPYTRGRERSRPAKEIVKEVSNLVKKDYKEIWLLGQNVNSYPNFPDLLRKVNNIPGDFKIYFMSPHPKDFSDDLIKAMKECKKVVHSLNLPLQSGDNKILRAMNRPYTVGYYKRLVKKIRKAIPDIFLSTDIIVGFPGETKKQFQNTVKLCKELKFNKAYISRYSPRRGTAAAKLKNNVSLEEKKQRWKILNDLINNN